MQISENRYKHGKRIALFLFAVVYMLCCMIPASVLAEGAMIGGGKAVIGQADGTGYGVKFYNADNGLQTDDANVVMLSSDGFIWIGGSGGLIRYDGTDFERQDPSGGITGVNTLFEDSKGNLWVGTNDNGVVCLHNDRSEHYYYKNGLNSSSVNAIAEDGSGNIIIGTKLGLYVIDEDRNISMIDAPELDDSNIRQLVTDGYGYIVGVTSSGAIFRLFGLRMTDYYISDDVEIGEISSVLPVNGSKDEVYFGTGSGMLCRGSFADKFASIEKIPVSYDRLIPDDSNGGWEEWDEYEETYESEDGQTEDDDSSSDESSDDGEDIYGPEQTDLYEHIIVNEPVNHLCYAADKIWILMNSHIFYYNGGTDFIPLDNVPLNSSVENMAEDFEGNLWFATKRQGVMKVTANRFMDLNAKAGIEAKNVNAVCIRDGLIYIGTDTGLQLVNSSYTPVDNMLKSVLPDVNVRCLTVDNENTIWASTFTDEKGIIGLTDDGIITFFTEDDGLPGNEIYCVAMAPDGSLLVATDNGLAVIKDRKIKRVINADNGLKNPIILTAEADEDGKYFLGSDGDGLYVVDGSNIAHFSHNEGLTRDVVMRVKNDKQRGIVWIITSNSIQYYKDGEIRTVEGFPYTSNYDIYFDKHGNAWVLSANGIYVASADDMLSKSRYDYSFYNSSDGLHSLPTPNSYSYLDSNGESVYLGKIRRQRDQYRFGSNSGSGYKIQGIIYL